MLITLKLPFPPSVNTYYRNFRGRMVMGKSGREFKEKVQEIVTTSQIPKLNDARLMAIISIFPPNKRKFDLDNRLKSVFDSLQDAGVYDNDEQFDKIEIARGEIRPQGGCTIVIATLDEA